jgi:hypothetical protein
MPNRVTMHALRPGFSNAHIPNPRRDSNMYNDALRSQSSLMSSALPQFR